MIIRHALAHTARTAMHRPARKAAPAISRAVGGRTAAATARAAKPAAKAATKAAKAAPRGVAAVKELVSRWFGLLDRNAPAKAYVPMIDDKGLKMAFPERTLRSHAEFKDWYGGILRAIKKASHTVERLDVKPLGRGRYAVDLNVRWRAIPTKGTPIDARFAQAWRVHDAKAGPRISEYLVKALG